MGAVQWLWLFVGGGLGAVMRFALGSWVLARAGDGFPWGTLAVNWVGCLAIGVAAALFAALPHGPGVRLFLVTGVLGGFTTFSTFGHETMALLRDGERLAAAGNVGLQLFVGLGCAWGGYALASTT